MIYQIVSFMPIAVCAFWAIALAISIWERGNRAAHGQLLMWAITATLLYIGHFVFFNRLTGAILVSDTIYVVCNLLVYPLYLYYITVLTKGKANSRQLWFTVLPAVVIGIMVATVYMMMSHDERLQFINTYLYSNSMQGLAGLVRVQAVIHQTAKILFAIGVVGVLFVAIRHIRHYNKLVDSIYADSDDKRLFGITTLLLLTVITGILSFTVNAVGRFVFLNSTVTLAALACFFCFLLYLICYRGFVQQFSFVDIENEERKDSIEDIKTIGPTEAIPQDGLLMLLKKIDDEQLFLRPGLTLAELAKQLGTNRTMLSKLINEQIGMPFAEFINRKRIAYFKKLKKEFPNALKQELAEKAGYTSMRSFYRNYHLYNEES